MDCCAGARHGLLGFGRQEKPPGFESSVMAAAARLHAEVRVPASLVGHHGKLLSRSHGIACFSGGRGPDRKPSSTRVFSSKHISTGTSPSRLSENPLVPQTDSSDDCNRAKLNERNKTRNALTGVPSSNPTVTTSDNNPVANEMDSSLMDEIAYSSLPSWDSTAKAKADKQNWRDPLPEDMTDELTKPGPLKEIYNHVSGETTSSPSTDSDSSLSHLLASHNVLEFISRFPSWADEQKESGMPKRLKRSFYSHEDWLRHRSSLRYIRHILSSVSSRVIVSLVPPVFTFTSIALVVAVYNTALQYGFLPLYFPTLHAASLPYELTAPALALLLVFRTDASYSRYNEARRTWTSIISSTKDLARLSAQLIRNPQDVELKSSILSYILAFPVSLKCHLIHGSDTLSELERLLKPSDLAFVLSSEHRPNCLIQLMSQAVVLLHLEVTDKVALENHLQQYVASVSICERLIFTPIPLSYTRLTSRFLVLWHMSLPLILWDACGWLVIPATFFSSSTLFCIEEVGVLIEEPFPMLALDKMIALAHASIHEVLKRQKDTNQFLSSKKQMANERLGKTP